MGWRGHSISKSSVSVQLRKQLKTSVSLGAGGPIISPVDEQRAVGVVSREREGAIVQLLGDSQAAEVDEAGGVYEDVAGELAEVARFQDLAVEAWYKLEPLGKVGIVRA